LKKISQFSPIFAKKIPGSIERSRFRYDMASLSNSTGIIMVNSSASLPRGDIKARTGKSDRGESMIRGGEDSKRSHTSESPEGIFKMSAGSKPRLI
jgi:hypothetical protein